MARVKRTAVNEPWSLSKQNLRFEQPQLWEGLYYHQDFELNIISAQNGGTMARKNHWN